MAQGLYKSGEIVYLSYQAVGVLSGAIPTGIVYDEAGAAHSAQTTALNSALVAGEIADGRYHGHFTPDAEGRWTISIADKNGDGEVSKNYNVCGFNIDALGDAQVALESGVKSDALLQQSAIVSSVKSDALLQQSAVVSSVKSALLVAQSALASSAKSAVIVETSDLKSAVIAQASDVKSAVLAIASPASVS